MALTDAMVALYSTTLAAATSSVTIAGIPSTGYRDLRLIINAKNSVNSQGIRVQFNDDTNSNYFYVVMYGTGSSAGSGVGSNLTYADFGVNRTTEQNTIADILDYATNKHKSILVRSDNASEITLAYANRWASAATITKIKIYPSDNMFTVGSTFTLYGIKA